MKPSTKRNIAIPCVTLALGCFLMAAGWGMGGSFSSGKNIDIGGSNGIQVGGDGIHIGGSNGVYVGPNGISIGGRNGIYVGPEGIFIGASGGRPTYIEQEAVIDSVVYEGSGVTTFYESDMIVKNVAVEPFSRLEVNIGLGDITVIADGDDYYVDLRYRGEGYELSYRLVDHTLVITSTDKIWQSWDTDGIKAEVTVIIPKGAVLEDMDLYTDLGDIVVSDLGTTVGRAGLMTDLGDVIWTGTLAKELTAKSDLGNVTIDFPASRGVSYDLSSGWGDVWVNGNSRGESSSFAADRESYYVAASTDMGDMNLTLTGDLDP